MSKAIAYEFEQVTYQLSIDQPSSVVIVETPSTFTQTQYVEAVDFTERFARHLSDNDYQLVEFMVYDGALKQVKRLTMRRGEVEKFRS